MARGRAARLHTRERGTGDLGKLPSQVVEELQHPGTMLECDSKPAPLHMSPDWKRILSLVACTSRNTHKLCFPQSHEQRMDEEESGQRGGLGRHCGKAVRCHGAQASNAGALSTHGVSRTIEMLCLYCLSTLIGRSHLRWMRTRRTGSENKR